jgi:hypothetical protein
MAGQREARASLDVPAIHVLDSAKYDLAQDVDTRHSPGMTREGRETTI